MKSKDLKLMRKKLAKANKEDYNPCSKLLVDSSSKLKENDPSSNEDDKASSSTKSFSIQYYKSGTDLSAAKFQQILKLFEDNMGDLYRNSSWDLNMEEKESELRHTTARYLLIIDDCEEDNNLAGFVHYRFEADDEEYPTQPVLYLYEIQISSKYQRQGLGKKLMSVIEQIGQEAEMPKIVLTVFKANKEAMEFYVEKLNYDIDETSPSNHGQTNADYEILSRKF